MQLNPFDAQAWYELGVKQQENEREHKAIEALRRAIELDPTSLSAWLALAVSYTNENNRVEAQEAISRWISQNEQYKIASARYLLNANRSQETQTQHHDRLIECLVDMARMAPEGQIDADIQIALAVLLNGSEVRTILACVWLFTNLSVGLRESPRLLPNRPRGATRCKLLSLLFHILYQCCYYRIGCCTTELERRWRIVEEQKRRLLTTTVL